MEAKEWSGRYSTLRPKRYIEYKPDEMHRPKFIELFDSPKILIQRLASGSLIQATMDLDKIYVNHVLNCVVKLEHVIHLGSKRLHLNSDEMAPQKDYDLYYLLAIITSLSIGTYHNKYLSPGLDIFPETMRNLPIRKINFTTPELERKALVEKLKEMYLEEVGQ